MSENELMVNLPALNDDISDIPQRTGYLPYLGIAYGTSQAVVDGIATPGDFVFEGKRSLGKKAEVIVADYRLHLSVWDNDANSTISDFYDLRTNPNRGKNEAYVNYQKQQLSANCKLHEGIDLLLWIPAVNSFAVIYLKSTTYDSFAPIYNAGKGGRLVQISTRQGVAKKTGRKFYLIDAVSLNHALEGSGYSIPGIEIACDISIPKDFIVAASKSFNTVESTEVSSESGATDR
jgi:hypothetical protein